MSDLKPVEIRELVDQQCDVFEAARQRGDNESIESTLASVPVPAREQLLVELLSLDMEWAARSGQKPDLDAYRKRFPKDATSIARAFDEFQDWVSATDIVEDEVKRQLVNLTLDTDCHAVETIPFKRETESSPACDELPRSIGRYDVVRKLGSGGMGTVLLVHDTALGRDVALKLPHLDTRHDSEALARFHREARAMASVHHANLCPIFDVGESDGRPFLTMAYIDGHSLAEQIDSSGPMPADHAARLVRKLALAIQAAHDSDVLHRDLKPSNVMIGRNGEPAITDFGLATLDRNNDSELTLSGAAVGSPAYMSPEQVNGRRDEMGPPTDVYALGVMLYQLLCGRLPFEGTGFEVMGRIAAGQTPQLPTTHVELDKRLENVCLRAMSFEPGDRFQSTADLAEALEPFCHKKEGAQLPSVRATKERKGLVAAGTVVFVALLFGAVWMAGWHPQNEAPPESFMAVRSRDAHGTQNASAANGPRDTPLPAIAPFDETAAQNFQQTWASHLGVPVNLTVDLEGVPLTMVLIPPGEFMMGSSPEQIETAQAMAFRANDAYAKDRIPFEAPAHRVTITQPFFLGKYELTQDQWLAVMDSFPVDRERGSNLPIEKISSDDVAQLLNKLNREPTLHGLEFHLPTEAQWEYACRAGTETAWYCGDAESDLPRVAHFADTARKQVKPVGELLPNAWGLFDMHGNVAEWCADNYEKWFYDGSPQEDPICQSDSGRSSIRGGDCGSAPLYTRCALRGHEFSDFRKIRVGVRLAATLVDDHLHVGEGAPRAQTRTDPPIATAPFDEPAAKRTEPSDSRAATSTDTGEMLTLSNGWQMGVPVNAGPNVNSDGHDSNPAISEDSNSLFFYSKRSSPAGLWISTRPSADSPWEPALVFDGPLHDCETDPAPHLSHDGLTMLFSADRAGGMGGTDLWQITRPAIGQPWSEPENLGNIVNTDSFEVAPALSADGLTLFFASERPEGEGRSDLWMTTRPQVDSPWTRPGNLGPKVNSSAGDGAPDISSDGLALVFESGRDGTHGAGDLWMCTRSTPASPWTEPVNLGSAVNSTTWDSAPIFTMNDTALFFSTRRPRTPGESNSPPNIWMVKVRRPE